MRYGSLFSGIGGIDLGLDRAGMECVWQVENDDYCLKVLAKHWPNVPKYEDIKELDARGLEPVDLVCGGFPCQDLSYAGKGAGLSGERSGLWSEYVRILRVVRPRYVLVENVPGLLSRGMGVVLGDLSSLGYDAEWESIPAAAFGAPHLRWRVFVVAVRQGDVADPEGAGWGVCEPQHVRAPSRAGDASRDSSEVLAYTNSQRLKGCSLSTIERQEVPDPPRSGQDATYSTGSRLARRQEVEGLFAGAREAGAQSPTQYASWWKAEPQICRVVDGFPGRVDRLRGLGNAVVPQIAEWTGNLIIQHDKERSALPLGMENREEKTLKYRDRVREEL